MRLAADQIELEPRDVEEIARRVAEILDERPEGWLDINAAAEYLSCPKSRLYNLVHQRRIDFRKDGSRLLFRSSALDAYLDGNGRGG